MTKETLKQVGRHLMESAITPNGFSDKFNELRRLKTCIQNEIVEMLSSDEQRDIMLSVRNEATISKLIMIGKRHYVQNQSEERLYMVAMSVGTIIKEYGWGTSFVTDDGLYGLALRIIS